MTKYRAKRVGDKMWQSHGRYRIDPRDNRVELWGEDHLTYREVPGREHYGNQENYWIRFHIKEDHFGPIIGFNVHMKDPDKGSSWGDGKVLPKWIRIP